MEEQKIVELVLKELHKKIACTNKGTLLVVGEIEKDIKDRLEDFFHLETETKQVSPDYILIKVPKTECKNDFSRSIGDFDNQKTQDILNVQPEGTYNLSAYRLLTNSRFRELVPQFAVTVYVHPMCRITPMAMDYVHDQNIKLVRKTS